MEDRRGGVEMCHIALMGLFPLPSPQRKLDKGSLTLKMEYQTFWRSRNSTKESRCVFAPAVLLFPP